MLARSLAFALCVLSGAAVAGPALAQSDVRIAVGTVTSTQTCQYFREYEGSSASVFASEYRRYWGYAARNRESATVSSWRSWVWRDCQTNFENLRHSLSAALASTGRLAVGGGGYRLDVTISNVSETPPEQSRPVRGDTAYHTSWGTASVNLSYTVHDRTGTAVDGGNIRKQIEMGRTLNTENIRLRTMEPGEAVYDLLQQEAADSVARAVVFDIDPITVTAVDGPRIEVNYGGPLLSLGDILLVEKSEGIGAIRYRVTSAGANRSVAEVDGDNDIYAINPGNLASFVEADSDASNGRRYERVRLP
ncbi:hypothetical protein [Aurantiacibacter suaedae]|uniref:hypothetical protein n=1 Tax=Aurantiacibacter suaedae TaxID=2545755 RepID=UPI0010F60796|nr:hypothetical protein [Aurantiacibacter suaedae]